MSHTRTCQVLSSQGPCLALAVLAALLIGWQTPSIARAATVTIGPSVAGGSGIAEGCPLIGEQPSTDCAKFTAKATGEAIAQAPSDGALTTWRIAGFSGTARLLVLKAASGNAYTIEARSAPVSEPCVVTAICGPQIAPYQFSLSPHLPISTGEYIGVEATGPPSCDESPDDEACTYVGVLNCTKGGEFLIWNTTPADGSLSTPDTDQECELAANAEEETTKTSVAVSLSPAKITADRSATATATAKVKSEGKPLTGKTISFASSDSEEKVGAVKESSPGTYTATITASGEVGTATVTATDLSEAAQPAGSATLTQDAPKIGVSVSRKSILANGKASATAKVKLTGVHGEAVSGQLVSIKTSGPALAGLVKDNGNGTYTTTITSLHSAGTVTITGTDLSVVPNVSGQATLTTEVPPPPKKKKKCKVPKLAGDKLATAKVDLRHAHCALGKVARRKSKKVHKGRVISSHPKAGTIHKLGTRVKLAVSRGGRWK